MYEPVRNEELHVWRLRLENGQFDPADLKAFTERLMADLYEERSTSDRLATEKASLTAENTRLNKIFVAAMECTLDGDSKSIQEGDKLDCALLHDIADLFASNRCTRADNALKTKMVDWLVDKLSFNTGCGPYYDECPRLCATGKRECLAHDFDAGDFDYGPCWKERARKEVMRHGS